MESLFFWTFYQVSFKKYGKILRHMRVLTRECKILSLNNGGENIDVFFFHFLSFECAKCAVHVLHVRFGVLQREIPTTIKKSYEGRVNLMPTCVKQSNRFFSLIYFLLFLLYVFYVFLYSQKYLLRMTVIVLFFSARK